MKEINTTKVCKRCELAIPLTDFRHMFDKRRQAVYLNPYCHDCEKILLKDMTRKPARQSPPVRLPESGLNLPGVHSRLEANVSVDPISGCWNWTGVKDRAGYGRFKFRGITYRAHRVSYALKSGAIPEGSVIDHLCRNPSCINPGHLEPVSSAENTRRGNSGLVERNKTHCPKGHPYEGDNLILTLNGHRKCRHCAREYDKKRNLENPGSRAKGSRRVEKNRFSPNAP